MKIKVSALILGILLSSANSALAASPAAVVAVVAVSASGAVSRAGASALDNADLITEILQSGTVYSLQFSYQESDKINDQGEKEIVVDSNFWGTKKEPISEYLKRKLPAGSKIIFCSVNTYSQRIAIFYKKTPVSSKSKKPAAK